MERVNKSKNRACLNCALILPSEKFKKEGCPNCPYLNLDRSRNTEAATSNVFSGQIYLLNPTKSWIAKWQRNKDCVPGFYAITVDGDLPDEFILAIEKQGIEYINRTHSFSL